MNSNMNQQQQPKKKKNGCLIAVIVFIIIIIIAAVAGSGSGDKDTDSDNKSKKAITGSSESSVSSVVKDDNTDVSSADGSSAEESVEESKEESKPKAELATIQEQVCFEKNGVKVTAVSLEDEMFGGKYIKLLVENNSDKTYTVGCSALIVNNCMISDLFASEVAAGKKSNEKLYLSSSDLEASGIENIGQIEIYFHMYEENDILNSIKIDPVVIKTSAFDKMDSKPDDSGHELYNKDGLKIVGKYVDENSFWGKSVLLYIENNTGKEVSILCDDLSVNGFMVNGYFASTVYNGKYAVDDITLSSSDLEDNNIQSVDDVELKFKITYDNDIMHMITTDAIKFSTKAG